MADQEQQSPQEAPIPEQTGPSRLPQAPTVPPPGTPPTETGTAPAAPPTPEPTPAPGEDFAAKLAQIEQDLKRARAGQSAADQRAMQYQQMLQQQQAQVEQERLRVEQQQQQLDQRALAELPEADRKVYEAQMLARRAAEQAQVYQQQLIAQQWRNRLTEIMVGYASEGIPTEYLQQVVNAATAPQQAVDMLQTARADYWRYQYQEAQKAAQQKPAQPVPQPQTPVEPQQPPKAPYVTTHTAEGQPTSLMDELTALAEKTRKSGKSTVHEALIAAEAAAKRR